MEDKAIFRDDTKIKTMIYEIRGKQVMLDADLARLYECKNGTKVINQAVRRHQDRFPEDFCFQLDDAELAFLRSQVGTASDSLRSQLVTSNERGGRRYKTYAFTEQGVAMLATILRTEVASRVSIAIMRAFVEMKQYISISLIEQKYINKLVMNHDERLDLVEKTLSKFDEKSNHLFFEGQIYDAYSLMRDILNKSQTEIIIIDNYINKNLLDILSQTKRKVIIITNKYNNNDYKKYQEQYSNIKLVINNTFHDRFIILDRKILYHCGASFKDLGKKCFAINKIEDGEYLERLVEKIPN